MRLKSSMEDPPVRERHLFFIHFLESEQGSGAGQELLYAVLSDEPGSLWVWEDNPRARAFYERNGFVLDGARQPTGFDTGGEEVRMLRERAASVRTGIRPRRERQDADTLPPCVCRKPEF